MSTETKTDAILKAVCANIESNRKLIDAAYWTGNGTVAIIVRLTRGRPFRVIFKTEGETNLDLGG